MYLKFDSQKAMQAIGVILRNHSHTFASKLRILKLLYIAERESIMDIGHPIIGSRVVAMDHGPLHSRVLEMINGADISEPIFAEHFFRIGYMLQMTEDPGVGRLSIHEVEKLQEVCERYAAVNDWELAQGITHGFKEWEDHYRGEGTSTIIPFEDIVDAVGRSGDKESILSDLRNEINADSAFGAQSL